MLDDDNTNTDSNTEGSTDTSSPGSAESPETSAESAPAATTEDAPPVKKAAKKSAKKSAAKKTAKKTAAKKKADAAGPDDAPPEGSADSADAAGSGEAPTAKKTAKKTAAKKSAKKSAAKKTAATAEQPVSEDSDASDASGDSASGEAPAAPSLLFQAPDPSAAPTRRRSRSAAKTATPQGDTADSGPESDQSSEDTDSDEGDDTDDSDDTDDTDDTGDGDSGDEQGGGRRRRRRGGRRRRRGGGGGDASEDAADADDAPGDQGGRQVAKQDNKQDNKQDGKQNKQGKQDSGAGKGGDADEGGEGGSAGTRRRRRRRRAGEEGDGVGDDPENTVTRVRKARSAEDEITSLQGSTRLEAKKQRRREGREAGRRRAPIVSEAEFLARREAVDRVMVIRQREDLTQIAVLEDKVLVEHYVARESQTSLIGNVYLGRVQNVLPSMEAAFIDIGKGRNAVLYAGEVNWSALGAGNGPRKIEQVLKSGQPILVQVTKDPIGHKGARLTSQVSLPGRFLVYVPDGTTSGISRKLPDTERSRLKTLLKEIVPDTAGVIVRTAAEGASEEELTLDVERLTARWSDIEEKVEKGNAPQLLYGEPDLTLKVVRDLFTEDFTKLVVSGDDAWDMVDGYVKHVAPDLGERLERYDADSSSQSDVFAAYRIDEQIAKGLDRKVWLPSGGSLIIDRTEAMTVVDVNTGKFTGSGGNLEETVTKNNLEAAEEMVRQLRLRDIGGIIVVDFIDMVLESNRDLVLRRLVECLGRDRTRHQVAEVTSLGLVQMTRKRIGTGLLEAFSESCEHCNGRGLVVHHDPVDPKKKQDDEPRRGRRGRGRGGDESSNGSGGSGGSGNGNAVANKPPSPADLAAMAKHEPKPPVDESPDEVPRRGPPRADGSAQETVEVPVEVPVAPAEPTPTPQTAAEDTPEPPVEVAEQPAQAGPPPVPASPTLVTSRRRVARRPAGPPSGGVPSEQEAATPTPAVGSDVEPETSQPVLTGPAPDGPAAADPPADQPVGEPGEQAPEQPADASPEIAPGEVPEQPADHSTDHSEPSTEQPHEHAHVPIKKKGSRKR